MGKKEKAPCLRFKDTNGKDYPAWEQRKLGELAATFGYGLNAAAKSFDGRHKYIRITDIDESTRRFLCSSLTSPDIDFEEAAPYRLAEGDVLFARTGASVGKSYRYVRTDGEVYFAGFLIRFRFKDKEAAEFVFQNSLTAKFQNFIKTSSQRSGQPGINAQQFSGYQIAVPNSEERERIGSFFSRLDTAITLHQRKLETLKKLKRTLLQKMFPKKGQLKPELRFPGFTNDWEQRKLGELAATFGYGLNAAAKSFDGRHKYIRITDIDESTRRFLCSSLTSPDIDFEEAAPYRLAEGDVLFARTGASVGKSYRYVRTDGEVYFAGFLIRFRFKDKEAAEFVFQNSLTAKFQNFIKTSSQRSGQPGINAQQFSGYQIAVPNSEERERIGSFFSRLDTAITLHQRKLETYKKLKKSLLQKMFI
ncbi:restriction endonuclease subunit S [Parasutterella excrementihominis]|uniref:restriction endonuclease subunit S n=1 Tax=Parasutterella excrementihominis TaxID=487175 RepID=UPI0012BC3818|nr:restriction endonuclease subunit S [Parasutterella excrementihominis]MTT65470.1 restriction endonuclease subunit S [Parasutterella excrementihominis]